MEQEQRDFELVRGPSSATIDHTASYIPLSPTTATMNSARPTKFRRITSYKPTFQQYSEQTSSNLPPTPTFTYPIIRHRPALLSGAENLAKAMGYKTQNVRDREVVLILADTLTFIEKLTAGKALTTRPRAMAAIEVRRKICNAIPRAYILKAGRVGEINEEEECLWNGVLERAATRYIKDLQTGMGSNPKIIGSSAQDEQDLGTILDKIEMHCTECLNDNTANGERMTE